MKKVISFCLWGSNLKYCVGAIKNAILAKKIYPDWTCRFYCSSCVPSDIIQQLREFENVEIILLNKIGNWKFNSSRFLAISDFEIDFLIFRDTDSRLNHREKYAVDEWIKSNNVLHIMRDHPSHAIFPIFAGMFGIKGKIIKNIEQALLNFEKDNQEHYNYDQVFLKNYIYANFKDSITLHDEIFNKNPFPSERKDYEFVGEVFDENDIRNNDHRNMLINFLK
jgi:protein O-GlcNAc transferase